MEKAKVRLWTSEYSIIIVLSFILFVTFYMITSGLPVFISTFNDNPAIAGIMTTTLMITSLITRFFASIIIQKVNMKLLLIISITYFAITIALTVVFDSIWALVVIRALQGIGFCMLTNLVFTISSNIIPKSRLGEGVVFFTMATSIGSTIGPYIAISYLANYSFSSMMLVTLGLMTITLLGSFFTKNTVTIKEEPAQVKSNEPFYKYMFDRRVLLPSILMAINYMTIAGVVNFMGAFGNEINLGGTISQFFIAESITMVIVRSFSGKIFDKYGHRILLVPGTIAGTLGLVLLGFSTNMYMVLLAGVLYGIAFGVNQPILQAWAFTLVPPEKKTTAMSMLLIFIDAGLAFGSLTLGLLAKGVGYGLMFSLSGALMMIILVLYLIGSRKTPVYSAN